MGIIKGSRTENVFGEHPGDPVDGDGVRKQLRNILLKDVEQDAQGS